MANHRRPDWSAHGTCIVCGGQTDRACGGVRPPRKTCSAECRRAIRIASVTTHGASRSPLYVVWGAIIQRATNPSCQDWPLYGGRGITMCERWRTSFEAFRDDMGPRPRGALIERLDNDGPYSPENCVWKTATEQMRNRRSTRFVEFNGQRRCVTEWAEIIGISKTSLTSRLNHGWSVERALTEPAVIGKNQSGAP